MCQWDHDHNTFIHEKLDREVRMEVKTYNVKKREEYFALQIVEEALEKKKTNPTLNCALYIKEEMNSQFGGFGWNCFFVDSASDLSWSIDPYKSIIIKMDDGRISIFIFRMVIKCF